MHYRYIHYQFHHLNFHRHIEQATNNKRIDKILIESFYLVFFIVINAINAKYNVFSEIRGKGLLIGAVLNDNYQGKAKAFLNAAMDEGVMVLVAGASIVRFAPSLVIPDEDITLGLARFEKAIASLV